MIEHTGGGLTFAQSAAVLYVATPDGPASESSAQLIAAVASATTSGRELADSLVGTVDSIGGRRDDEVPPFGLVSSAPDGIAVVLAGEVTAECATEDRTWTLATEPPTRVLNWFAVDPPDQVRLVSAGGVVHLRVEGSAGSPERQSPHRPDAADVDVDVGVHEILTGLGTPSSGSEPVQDPGAASAMESGTLTGSDGVSITLMRDTVLGREPSVSPLVSGGSAEAAPLEDDELRISRVHALVAPEPGLLRVTDLGSSNGTWLRQPGEPTWRRLLKHGSNELASGGSLRIGGYELTFVSPYPDAAPGTVEPITGQFASPTNLEVPHPQTEHGAPPTFGGLDDHENHAASPTGADAVTDREGIGDYEFRERLSSSEGGSLFLATPPARLDVPDDRVVVKVFVGPSSDDAFRRAARELRAVAATGSPHLIKILDAGRDGAELYYAMRFIRGGSLAAPTLPVEPDDALRAIAQAARAAHALHEAGVVHNGITPANVLIDSDGTAYLTNPGMAQILTKGRSVTTLGPVRDVEYLDPAILLGGFGSPVTDVWSLGAVIHRIASGEGIYGELPSGPLVSIRTVLAGHRTISPLLPDDIAELVRSCLEPEPDDRPQTALQLAERLESIVDGAPGDSETAGSG